MQRVNDKVTYAKELLDANLNVSYATNVYNNVYVLRTGLNNVNFDVVKYEQMASAGRSAEALINVDLYRDYYYTPEGGEKTLVFSSLDSEKDDALKAYNTANNANRDFRDFEAVVDYSKAVVTSTASTFELREALRNFNDYMAKVLERGYVPAQLEQEIRCAVAG